MATSPRSADPSHGQETDSIPLQAFEPPGEEIQSTPMRTYEPPVDSSVKPKITLQQVSYKVCKYTSRSNISKLPLRCMFKLTRY